MLMMVVEIMMMTIYNALMAATVSTTTIMHAMPSRSIELRWQ